MASIDTTSTSSSEAGGTSTPDYYMQASFCIHCSLSLSLFSCYAVRISHFVIASAPTAAAAAICVCRLPYTLQDMLWPSWLEQDSMQHGQSLCLFRCVGPEKATASLYSYNPTCAHNCQVYKTSSFLHQSLFNFILTSTSDVK